ncbi:MAG: hypothetical protein OEW83_05035 [Acidimicrobiia bacterium]|nr:hypothetical protein [Acidimicrobiia bacterium]
MLIVGIGVAAGLGAFGQRYRPATDRLKPWRQRAGSRHFFVTRSTLQRCYQRELPERLNKNSNRSAA